MRRINPIKKQFWITRDLDEKLEIDADSCYHINSVAYIDGKKLVNEEKTWFINRKTADEICMSHGFSVIAWQKSYKYD